MSKIEAISLRTISTWDINERRIILDNNEKDDRGGVLNKMTINYIVKSIWLTCLTGLCIFLLVSIIRQYLSQTTNTRIEEVRQESINLPVVTVCNLNRLLTDQAYQYIADYYMDTYNVTFDNYTQLYDSIRRNEIPDDVDWLLYRTYETGFNATLRKSFGLIELLWCQLNNSNCDSKDLTFIYHPKYGNCVVFNSASQSKKVSQEEIGIEMSVFMGLSEENKSSFVYEETNKGIVVLIDDQKTVAIDKEGIILKPGLLANIALRKSINDYTTKNCIENTRTLISDQMRHMKMSYDRRNCFTLCRQKKIIDRLGCYDMRYPHLLFNNASIGPCNDQETFRRLDTIRTDECELLCPLECTKTSFDWEITYGEYPSYAQFIYLNKTNDGVLSRYSSSSSSSSTLFSVMKRSCAHFIIYFDPLTVTRLTQSPNMTVFDILANIGGILALFLGISLLSLIELTQSTLSLFLDWKKNGHVKQSKKTTLFQVRSALDAIHRINQINRFYIKLIWSVAILTALALCTWMIINSLMVYSDYKTKSVVRKWPQPNLTFPTISICDSNYFKTQEASEYMTSFLYNSVGANFTNFQQLYDFTNDSIYNILAWKFYETFSPQFNASLRRSLGYSLDELVIKCEFDSRPCNRSWFDWYYHPSYGNCYKFNSGYLNGVPNSVDILTVNRPNTGLYMELFRGLPDDYYNFYFYESKANALYMSISDHKHVPIDKFGRPFKVGTATLLGLSLNEYHNLPEPYSDCRYTETIDSEIVKLMRQSNISYDQHNCIEICLELQNYNEIGCYSMAYPNIYNLSLCTTQTQFWQASYIQPTIDRNECERMCPSECERTSYETHSLSYALFPSRNYAAKLLDERHEHFARLFKTQNVTYDMFAKSVTSLFVYFDDQLVLTRVTQSPSMNLVDLMSNIGGYLGLFIGMSLLSFFDLVTELASLILRNNIKERK